MSIDRVGQQFGRLTVVSSAPKSRTGAMRWNVACACGGLKTVFASALVGGLTRSCGCIAKERGWTGGRYRTYEYEAWKGARARCVNPKTASYPNYGGRGIRFMFDSLDDWCAELGPRPSPAHTVDRINNDGHYEPGNIRWATMTEQASNRRCPCPDCPKLRGHAVEAEAEVVYD